MQVILTQDVKGLGKANQMVKASDGYARNYLLPKGLAIEATSSNISVMKARQESERTKDERERQRALDHAKALSELTVMVKMKTGDNGKLYGSLTSKEIVESLKAQHNVDIDKNKIKMGEAIKQLGEYTLEVKLYPQITAKIKVAVIEDK